MINLEYPSYTLSKVYTSGLFIRDGELYIRRLVDFILSLANDCTI
jgi:hypothetical protein